ncbi:MAG: DUF58 domain-containing protein [Bacteroidota bacterium]
MLLFSSTYLTRLFFFLFSGLVVLFAASFAIPTLFSVASVGVIVLVAISVLDWLLIFSGREPLSVERKLSDRMNLGDVNHIKITVKNTQPQPINFTMYEGYPVEMQEREKSFHGFLLPGSDIQFAYDFIPKTRGKYAFGAVFFEIASVFGLVSRRFVVKLDREVAVYPSVLQMKKFELLVFQQQRTSQGIKRIRRIGNNSEFEQIKAYVQGDEPKTINWKATSRRFDLMVNQYQEEKSQHIFCIIDKSRNMQVTFDDMTVLDHSINSTLVFSNIALRNGDKTGLITFSDKLGTCLPANRNYGQLKRILEELYDQRTAFQEPNYELLFQTIRRTVSTRSLLVLFTNFQTEFAMRRALPMLRKINQHHLLVVVFFENTELQEYAFQPLRNTSDVYLSAVAERMITLKSKMAHELKQNGIQTILTSPAELSIQTINKYLELKAKGAI